MISQNKIGEYDGLGIFGLQIDLQVAALKLKATCYSVSRDPLFTCIAQNLSDLQESLAAECDIDRQLTAQVFNDAADYRRRFLEAEAFNDVARKASAGLMSQVTFETVIYSIVGEPAQRYVYPNADEDRVNPACYTVYAQLVNEPDPDHAYLWEQMCDSELSAALIISQDIQKQVLKTLLPEQFQ